MFIESLTLDSGSFVAGVVEDFGGVYQFSGPGVSLLGAGTYSTFSQPEHGDPLMETGRPFNLSGTIPIPSCGPGACSSFVTIVFSIISGCLVPYPPVYTCPSMPV